MPATKFICPNGKRVTIKRCLAACPQQERCMFLPTLRAVAKSLDRGIKGATVTELISGIREAYLKKKTSYAVDPQKPKKRKDSTDGRQYRGYKGIRLK